MPRPLPLVLEIPRHALARRDLVPTLVARSVRPERSVFPHVTSVFALTPDELAFARELLERHSQHHLFRSNQRAFCGDFVVVDCSPPDPSRRRAVVLELKLGAPLRTNGGGAGVQLQNADAAVREIARRTSWLLADAELDVVTGSREAVLEHLVGENAPIARASA